MLKVVSRAFLQPDRSGGAVEVIDLVAGGIVEAQPERQIAGVAPGEIDLQRIAVHGPLIQLHGAGRGGQVQPARPIAGGQVQRRFPMATGTAPPLNRS